MASSRILSRRMFLSGIAGTALLAPIGQASAFDTVALRGSLDATEAGLRANGQDDQSRAFQAILDNASDRDEDVFLPAGTYRIADVRLPARVRLFGVEGATRIVLTGNTALLHTQASERILFDGLTFDGVNRSNDLFEGLLDLRNVPSVTVRNCTITGAGKHGLYLEQCGGRVQSNTITGAMEAALWSVNAQGLTISDNVVSDCSNGGIWVHRWQPGHDGSMVTANRVSRIGSTNGGTGQWGNGINVFRADNVMIANNTIEDCAFSAIRSNSGSNVQITDNHCRESGETAIYAEFQFQGAIITGNVVDGAANGISVVNFNEGGRLAVVSSNLVRNLKATGPYPPDDPGFGTGIAIEADTSCTGNVVENAPLYGIHIGWGEFMRNVVATGNVIRDCATGIAVTTVEGTGTAVVTDNVIGGPGIGIAGYRWTEQATGDLARGAKAPDNLTVERNRVD